jgi:glycosyltransferase involved in cell wall biosynthesis
MDPDDDRYVVDIVGPIMDEAYASQFPEWEHRMHGYSDDIESYYEKADVALIPSEHDNHPTTAIESAGAGCCILITDTCGFSTLPEVKRNYGIDIVSGGREMVRMLEWIIEDTERLAKKKQAAYDLSGKMTWEEIARDHVQHYKDLLSA